MSKRITQCFQQLSAQNRKALIPYISAGDPLPEKTVEIMHALVRGGADLIELGVPFSDPAADGETIQQANERALARGITLIDVLTIAKAFRQTNNHTPLIIMGYLNSFERRMFASVMKEASAAGIDGVILVDCPIEALPDYQADLQAAGVAPILLLAPTTGATRQNQIIQAAQGFIYYVSLRGVTGKQAANAEDISAAVTQVKAQTHLPVCIGFGIRDGKTARAMAEFADGVVIGSALVAQLYAAAENDDDVITCAENFVHTIRSALDAKEDNL
ncbi:tryptophan synthase subunit alpha [Suttonella ornithocola]|uniref:Tryptophan synthase alpha chain n=1 Tax=Suttonella ornithocola TaxID=279832 RepID=A0A380MYI5_9GAMM|nr:tryptophan synthase subunit alpha [Suttonella ornithocola]SUO97609.1 Tryptophan synthase alpha chain [Suttonella ornithocola]